MSRSNLHFTKEKTENIVRDYIEECVWGGQSSREFAKQHDISENYCSLIRQIISLAKSKDTSDMLKKINSKNCNLKLVEAVYNVANIPIPEEVKTAIKDRAELAKQKTLESAAKGREAMQEMRKKQGKINAWETPLWEQQKLLNEATMIELFNDMSDAVIPKYAKDIVDAINKLDTHLVQLINKL